MTRKEIEQEISNQVSDYVLKNSTKLELQYLYELFRKMADCDNYDKHTAVLDKINLLFENDKISPKEWIALRSKLRHFLYMTQKPLSPIDNLVMREKCLKIDFTTSRDIANKHRNGKQIAIIYYVDERPNSRFKSDDDIKHEVKRKFLNDTIMSDEVKDIQVFINDVNELLK